ncbi:MAG TPA: GntR family transcriptional regulator [Halanaerobiales bacterium]|nr:GntR family transcriptional regulator [Halanaerobiales bacterium]
MRKSLPGYKRIASVINSRIHKGLYPPSSYLPSENTLAAEFGVTRATVRKALNILKQQGTVESFQGKGYQVKSLYWEQSLLQFYSFGRDIAGKIENTRTELLSCNLLDDLKDIEDKGKRIFEQGQLWEISRLRLIEDTPIILETSYIPKKYLLEIEEGLLLKESLYDLLEKFSIRIIRAREYLEPVTPDKASREKLKVKEDTALFRTSRYTYDSGDRLVEFRDSLIRGDCFRFSVEMTI